MIGHDTFQDVKGNGGGPAPEGNRRGGRPEGGDTPKGGARGGSGSRGGSGAHSAIRVCVVDDDRFVTASLATILAAEPDIEVAGQAHDGAAAEELYGRERPDVLLMDIQMPGTDGLAAAERILAADPRARIVFLTTFSDDEYIVRALRLGAKGYLIKQEVATIAPALRSVMAGQNVLGGEVIGRVDALMRGGAPRPATAPAGRDGAWDGARASRLADKLTERELAIVELIAQGFDNKEIAGTLYLSEGTVRNHISTILQKLHLKNRTQLAILYYR